MTLDELFQERDRRREQGKTAVRKPPYQHRGHHRCRRSVYIHAGAMSRIGAGAAPSYRLATVWTVPAT